jgi:hypothetical protein
VHPLEAGPRRTNARAASAEKGGSMYVGVGTILAIVLIILLIYLLT